MLLQEIAKNILCEGVASAFLKFYYDLRVGRDPDRATIFSCLMTLKEYYEGYLKWYKEYREPYQKQEEWQIIRDFNNRLKEINVALDSDDIKKQIIAVDNGINQWHIDFPVVYHQWLSVEDEESGEASEWEEVQDLLLKLGKLSIESPYKYRGNPENFPPSKRHLAAILPKKKNKI